MLTYLLSHLKAAKSATRAERKPRRLQLQPLESRAMMAAVPALSSLPGLGREHVRVTRKSFP